MNLEGRVLEGKVGWTLITTYMIEEDERATKIPRLFFKNAITCLTISELVLLSSTIIFFVLKCAKLDNFTLLSHKLYNTLSLLNYHSTPKPIITKPKSFVFDQK